MTSGGGGHEEQESLGAYALGALLPDEARAVEAHLATCPACRAELAELRWAVNVLPLSLEEMEASHGLRGRILAAAGQVPRPASVPAARPLPTPLASHRVRRGLPWAVAAALLVALLGTLAWNLSLRDEGGPAPRAVALRPAAPDVTGGGEVTYLPGRNVLVLDLRDLPSLPADRVYQVWLIKGSSPSPAGTFPAGTTEFALAADPDAYDLLAITEEPGPLGMPQPSGRVLYTAPLGTG